MSAAPVEFGPLELFIVAFDGDKPDASVLAALRDLGDGSAVRLVDLVVAVRLPDGEVRVSEIADLGLDLSGAIDLVGEGLVGDEDVADAIEDVAPGSGIALAALEMRWAANLSSALASTGGHVVHVALIPGPAVNQLVAEGLLASTAGED